MKTVFLLLLLANFAFLVYGVAREGTPVGNPIASLEVNSDRIRVIHPRDQPSSAGDPSTFVATTAPPCIEWGVVAGPAVARADAAIATLNLTQTSVKRTAIDAGGYWVYLPPVKSKAELDRNLAELSALGLSDFFFVEESTAWRNAVSLGIFKDEDAAMSFLQAIRAKGVTAAVVGHRKNLRPIAYFVRDPDAATVARLVELQRDFPGTQIRAAVCPVEMQ